MLFIKIQKIILFLFVVNLTIICDGIKLNQHQTGYNLDGGFNDKRQTTNNNGYRWSLPKTKNPLNRVPGYLQDVDYTKHNRPLPAGTDAIRIVDPPQYFQEQKHRFQKSPLTANHGEQKPTNIYHGSQQESLNNYYQDQNIYGSSKQQHKLHKRPQHQALTSSALRYPIESTYNGPEYLPLALPANSQPPSPRPQKYVAAHHAIAISHPKPTPTYLGIQTPSSNSLRAQVQRFKEQQKHIFEDDEDEHPARTNSKPTYKRKPVIQNSETKNEYIDEPIRYDYDEKSYNKKPKDSSYTNTYAVVEHTTPDEYETSTFTPYRLLASTRHRNRVTHKQKEPSNENPKERLRTEKKHIVYSEQGFEDTEYDHGDEERHSKRKKKYRQKRNVDNNSEDHYGYDETMEELPITINMMNINGEKLTGKALILHITELLKNTTKYLPNDDEEVNDSDSLLLQPLELEQLFNNAVNFTITMPDESKNKKLVYKHISLYDTETDPQLRFSAAIQASPYRNFQSFACDEIQPNFEQNDKKKKLGNLGNQLDCIKKQLFGKDPFSDRFFGDNYDPQSPIPASTNFRSKLVYDDVMKTIQSALGSEKVFSKVTNTNNDNSQKKKKKKRTSNLYQSDSRTLKNYDSLPELSTITVLKKSPKKQGKLEDNIKSYVFDITKFIPKTYMIRSNGKIYRINYRPNNEIPVALVNYNYKKENKPILKSRRRNTGIVITTVDGHKKKKIKNDGKNREILLSSLSKKSPEVVAQKFSHENGMTRYNVNQQYQT